MSRYHIIQPGTRINFSFYDDNDAPRKGNNSQIWLFVKDGVVRGVQVPWKRPSVDKSPLTRDFNIRNKQQLTILVESEIKFESLVHVYLNRINHHMLAFERGLRWEDKRYARKKLFKLDDSDGNFIRPSVLRTHLHVMLTTFRGLRHEFYEDAGDIVGIKKNMVLLSSVSAPKDTRRVKSGQEVACYFQQQQSVFARQFVILAKGKLFSMLKSIHTHARHHAHHPCNLQLIKGSKT